jgi:hypothetical protein
MGQQEERIQFKGVLQIYEKDEKTDKWKKVRENKNMVVDSGLLQILEAIRGTYGTYADMKYFAIGTGTAAPLPENTALGTEQYRKAIQSITRDDVNYTLEFLGYIGTTEYVGDISEYGLFNASAGGDMFCQVQVSPTYSKSSAVEINLKYYLTAARPP